MGLWDVLTADRLARGRRDATKGPSDARGGLTLEVCFDPNFWRDLRCLVQIVPNGEILPTRADYTGLGQSWEIGVNPLHADGPMWFALPDVVASTLLSGRAPAVMRAIELVPSSRLASLRPTRLRGEVAVNPEADDFFTRVIEERNLLTDRKGRNKRLDQFLKVLANAASYGIFAEMIRHELPKTESLPIDIYGLGPPRMRDDIPFPEEPGEFAFPPMAALITAAARLMLALLERSVTDVKGTYVMTDTDSMAIVSTEAGGLIDCPGGPFRSRGTAAVRALSWEQVAEIQRRFQRLNPYRQGTVEDLLKLEDENFVRAATEEEPDRVDRDRRLQLHAYAISAKRYALFNLDGRGRFTDIRKASQHGLGHVMNPRDPDDREWIKLAWRNLIERGRGRPTRRLGFEHRPAVTRTTVSSWALLHPFEDHNRGRPAHRRVRPFNFLLSAHVAPFGHPAGVQPERFHLIAPYEQRPQRWSQIEWTDRYSKPVGRYRVTTGPAVGELVRVRSIASLLTEYRTHPEAKSLGPGGRALLGDDARAAAAPPDSGGDGHVHRQGGQRAR